MLDSGRSCQQGMDNTQQANYTTSQNQSQIDGALWEVERIILNTLDFNEVNQKICNNLLTELNYLQLGYRIVVLALAQKEKQLLKRISISQTEEAKKALALTPISFSNIDIPLSALENLCIKVYTSQKPETTSHWPDILVPPFTPDQALQIQQALGIKSSIVYPIVAKNEALGVLIFSLIKDASQITEQEKNLLAHFTDVVGIGVQNAQLFSALEQTTKNLQQANIQAGLAGKVKTDLLTMASHEFRTPLTIMTNALWFLNNPEVKSKLTPKEVQNVERIVAQMERLNYLVQNLTQMLTTTSGDLTVHLAPVQLEILLREVLENKKTEIEEKRFSVVYHEPDNLLPLLSADRTKLQYVMGELVTNAIKYTPEQGKITITLQQEPAHLTLTIADTGAGIAKEEIASLFDGFHKIDAFHTTAPGMGLGLYIVKKIIDLHHGTMTLASTPGVGTTVTIILPLPEQAPAGTKAASQQQNSNLKDNPLNQQQ